MNRRGWTLTEVLIVVAIAGALFMLAAPLIRSVGRGTVSTQRTLDRQREVRTAMEFLQRDLLSARPCSVANVLADGDFEQIPFRPARGLPSHGENWIFQTVLPRRLPERFAQASVRAHPDMVKTGQWGLVLTATGIDYAVQSKPFTLPPGGYVVGGWVKSFNRGAARPAAIRLRPASLDNAGQPLFPPTAVESAFAPGQWTFAAGEIKISETATYQVDAGFDGMTSDPENRALAAFDGIRLIPLDLDLTPGAGQSLEFDRFDGSGPNEGRAQRIRYSLLPQGDSGLLVRDTLSGSEAERTAEFPHIRRLHLTWDFFQSTPGTLPDPLPADFFAKGFVFPLLLTMESGDRAAPGGSLTVSVQLPRE